MNALELADELEDEHYPWPRFPAAAELRRLHEENEALREANETFGKRQEWWNDKMVELEAQRDALLEALKMIAGTAPCIDNLMSDKDIARAAIARTEAA